MAIGADFRDLPTPGEMCVAMRRPVCALIFTEISYHKEKYHHFALLVREVEVIDVPKPSISSLCSHDRVVNIVV